MNKPEKRRGRYRRAFFAGLATLLPTILTIYVLFLCYSFVYDNIAQPINNAIASVLKTEPAREFYWKRLWNKQDFQLDDQADSPPSDVEALGLPDPTFDDLVDNHVPGWLGFVFAVILVLGVGFLFKGYLGRQLFRAGERLLLRVPLIKIIYPYAKQVTEFFFQEKKQISYEAAVCIEYPRRGVYSLGFVTNEGMRDVVDHAGRELVSIFIPSSPTPVTGYTIQVPREEIIKLSVSVDEAIRYAISGGVILPPSQLPPIALQTKRMPRPKAVEGESPSPDEESGPSSSN